MIQSKFSAERSDAELYAYNPYHSFWNVGSYAFLNDAPGWLILRYRNSIY